MLKIVKYPDPILKRKSEDVRHDDKSLRSLIPQMIDAMKKNQGIGLAAPQINVFKRAFVALIRKKFRPLINARVIKSSQDSGTYLDSEETKTCRW